MTVGELAEPLAMSLAAASKHVQVLERAGLVGGFDCELVELEPDRRIVYRWGFVGPQRTDGPTFDSLLTVTLGETPGGGTALTLVHERLDDLTRRGPERRVHPRRLAPAVFRRRLPAVGARRTERRQRVPVRTVDLRAVRRALAARQRAGAGGRRAAEQQAEVVAVSR
ncbi:SRPBCC domain-containing protein [Micromonospora sp. ATA32]|nr:SRPBCC domain-containing protein [Micromonospora sp. ATA32]